MFSTAYLLKEKEKRLVQYLEVYSTEEILQEVEKYLPTPQINSEIINKLNEIDIPQPVVNTLIIYDLTINKDEPLSNKTLKYAELCKKSNISNAQDAISFFKQYHISTMIH